MYQLIYVCIYLFFFNGRCLLTIVSSGNVKLSEDILVKKTLFNIVYTFFCITFSYEVNYLIVLKVIIF